MIRAARFVSQLEVAPAARVVEAMRAMGDRLEIVSAERIRDELDKLLVGDHAPAGLELLVETGLADRFLPEVPGAAAGTGPRASAQGRAPAHVRRGRAVRARRRAAAGGAAARHRQARDAQDHARGRHVPSPRDGGRAHGARPVDRAALPERDDRRRVHADRAAPPLPRLRGGGGLDRRGRAPLRPRRRTAARQAEPAHPRRRHHAQRTPSRGVREAAGRSGGADRGPGGGGEPRGDPPTAGRPPGDGAARPATRARRRRGARLSDGAAAWSAG